jgi:membrane fusion protein, multidrug efflux system
MKKVAALSVVSIGLVLGACGKSKPPVMPLKHVDVGVVHPYNVPYVFDYPAVVQGIVDYPVIPRVGGAVYKQYYTEGTYVKKDQPLYQIDPRPFELNLQNAQGNLVRDKAAMDNYKIIYDRYVQLFKTFAVSKQDTETALISYQNAAGAVKTDQALINQAKLDLEYAVVRAPASGYISERMVTVGDMVTAYVTQMNTINSVDNMYINFSIPENDRLAIQSGMIAGTMKVPPSYKFRIDVELADNSIMKNSGYVQFTDTRIGLQNGVWNMRAYVDNKKLKNQLLAGQFVHVYLHGAQYQNAFAVPQVAVFRDDNGAFVYLMDGDKVVKQPVVTGRMVGDLWVINSGLKNNDKVVVNGGVKISPDDRVAIDSDKDLVQDNSNPASKPVPKSVTPRKVNASAFKRNMDHKVYIDNSANTYHGKY